MKISALFCLFTFLSSPVLAQGVSTDTISSSPTGERTNQSNTYVMSGEQKAILSRSGILFAYNGIQLSPIENQILDIEGLERNALLKRDTMALRQIWLRDFTLDSPRNKVMTGKNPLPYYVVLSRLVERCTPVGDLIFTSGVEIVQELNPNGQLAPQIKQKFFHTWTNQFGRWRLSTNTHE